MSFKSIVILAAISQMISLFGFRNLRVVNAFSNACFVRKTTSLHSTPIQVKDETNIDTVPLRYVMIEKNKQSMAFRNGSPLVFSGSVKKTIAINGSNEGTMPLSCLVGIVVENENNNNVSKRSTKRGRSKGSLETKIKYNHYDVQNVEGKEFDMDGNLLNTVKDVSSIKRSISEGKLIGFGFFNPVSMYRVFIFCHQSNYPELFKTIKKIMKDSKKSERETTEEVIELVLKTKFQDAMRARMLMNLPSDSTDSYRLVNGEGDGLSGLAVDILGGKVAVVMISASWGEIYKNVVIRALKDILSLHPVYGSNDKSLDVVCRNTPLRLKQDGYVFPEEEEELVMPQSPETPVIINENSVKYFTYPYDLSSQKTGFYCDQRDNRFNLAKKCHSKNVLDLCCYNGGFALNAMIHGGAKSCIGVDSSQDAIDAACANAELNDIDPNAIRFIKEDIADFMRKAADEGKEFDVIVLDPPKLAPTVTALDRAARKYHSLNRDAIKLINSKDGGLLLTCTCSGAMTQKNGGQFFLETVKGAALAANRRITLLHSNGAAPCHTQCPASFPANAYLTAALFYISPAEEP